jgi:hypothetical protein
MTVVINPSPHAQPCPVTCLVIFYLLFFVTPAVSFKTPLDDDDTDHSGSSRAASPLPAAAAAAAGSSGCASPRHRRIMRCNTMPVQQAEAMQQLLQQVRLHVEVIRARGLLFRGSETLEKAAGGCQQQQQLHVVELAKLVTLVMFNLQLFCLLYAASRACRCATAVVHRVSTAAATALTQTLRTCHVQLAVFLACCLLRHVLVGA